MGTSAITYLPDGNFVALPKDPRTWVDAAPGVLGDGLRAPLVTADASAGVLWHRQRPLFQAIPLAVQSIATSTMTPVTGLAELIDNYSGHSDTTNTGRYYVPSTRSNTTGGDWYLCSGYVPFNSNDAAHVFLAGLRDTGGTTMEGGKIAGGAGHVVDTMAIDLLQMSGISGGNGDYVELMAWQNTGAAVNTLVSGKSPSLTVRWVAADQAWAGAFTPALPSSPHVWTDADIWAGSATGGGKIPANTEVRDLIRFLHNPPIARVTSQSGAQTIPTGAGTWTSLNWTTTGKTVDNYSGWASGTPSRYTAQRAGLYLVAGLASVAEPGANSGYRAVRLLQTFAAGGTQAYAGWSCLPQTSGTTGTAIYAMGLIRMAAGDYIETQMSHTQGAALTVNTAVNNCSRMIAVWMAK